MIKKKHYLCLQVIFLLGIFFLTPKPAEAYGISLPSSLKVAGLNLDYPVKNEKIDPDFILKRGILVSKPIEGISKNTAGLSIPSEENLVTVEKPPAPAEESREIVAEITPALAPEKPKETPSPTPSSSPSTSPSSTPTQTPQNKARGLDAEKLFSMSNSYRASKGLPAFEKDERSCKLAQERAPEIGAEIAGGYMHKGMYGRNLSYWNTENIITMNSEEAAFNWWIHDYIHRVQIEGDFKYSCVACSGNECAQEFTNFTPKG